MERTGVLLLYVDKFRKRQGPETGIFIKTKQNKTIHKHVRGVISGARRQRSKPTLPPRKSLQEDVRGWQYFCRV